MGVSDMARKDKDDKPTAFGDWVKNSPEQVCVLILVLAGVNILGALFTGGLL